MGNKLKNQSIQQQPVLGRAKDLARMIPGEPSMKDKILKQFRIEEKLGQGGMGVVYRCQDTRLERPVALKLLAAELMESPERKRRFLLEARAAARVSHPAIAQIYDVDEENGVIFIAMELVEGRTVKDLIRKHDLDLLGTIDIAIQVAEGLSKAHESGIIHRDIKPANVMLADDGRVKILDFGLAKLMGLVESGGEGGSSPQDLSTVTQTQMGAVMGTAPYMSPEQIRGGAVDGRSDIFSLGVMIFEMTTGELPFRRTTPMETMQAVAFDETPSLHTLRPNLPIELQRIVARCLRKRPEDRYPDARTLAQDLGALRRETETGRLRPHSVKERWVDTLERFRHLKPSEIVWLSAGAAVLLLVVYLLLSDQSLGGTLFFLVVGIFLARHIRNRPQRMLELLVRNISKIPEVRMITAQQGKIDVVVDRFIGQLYGRINRQLNDCNKKLFLGPIMTVAVRHDVPDEEIRRILSSPGVQYVRDDQVLGESSAGETRRLSAADTKV